jgi:penicillin-binding protein 1B
MGAERGRGVRRLRSLGVAAALAAMLLVVVGVGVAYLVHGHLVRVVDEKFAGRRWEVPSRIQSGEFLLYPGLDVERAGLEERLDRRGYRESADGAEGGDLRRIESGLEIALRPGARGRDRTRRVRLDLRGTTIERIVDLESGEEVAAVALEPEELTGIYEGEWKERRVVRVLDVAPVLIRAILATEDRRFFEHEGVDWIGISRAAWTNLRSGEVRQGGSTLTQQLMKNFFLTTDRTFARKLQELAMAVVAERRYSKMQILENYLNEVYLGQQGARGIFGVAEAAHFYFGKDPRDLDVGEAAFLAGILRAPNLYSPSRSPERARARRDTVLRLLRDAGEIDDAAYEQFRARPLGVVSRPERTHEAPYFVDHVKQELADRFPSGLLTTEGLEIATTLDPWMQDLADRAVRSGLQSLEEEYPRLREAPGGERLQAALVAIAPRNGEIKAMVGGRSYAESQFNRVTNARRQPGSTFKPIVYLAGLTSPEPERHITPATLLKDVPFTWVYDGSRRWSPRNYGDDYRGEVTVRTAVEESLNAAAAHVARAVGLPAIAELAHEMGVQSALPEVPALSLGSSELTLLEITSVYAVLASGGIRVDPIGVTRVTARDGEVIVGDTPPMRQVVSADAAYVMTHLLQGVLDHGTARGAREAGFGRPAAGKTGTTNDFRDAWFVGYTPDLVAGVWVGFDREGELNLSGARAALPIWTEFMKAATAWEPERPFRVPPGVVLVSIDRRSGEPAMLAGAQVIPSEDVVEEAFLAGDEPLQGDPADIAAFGLVPDEPGQDDEGNEERGEGSNAIDEQEALAP